MRRRLVLHTAALPLTAALAAGFSASLSACRADKPAFNALDITGAPYGQDFDLIDFHGQPRTLADFKGQAVLVFFGYTQCPDVCPTTMGEMALLRQQLGADGQRLQVLFISVDPARDTPEILRAYTSSFDQSFLALYARSPQALAQLARDFRVYYRQVPGKTPDTYTVDHSANSFVYDPQGRLRLSVPYGMAPEKLAQDVRRLLQGE